ncbi:MAG TPA: hypothetical protein VF820_01170 [Patescibacteria group bacterium]
MSETEISPTTFNYESKLPADAKEYGFKIIRTDEASSIPVSKIVKSEKLTETIDHELSPAVFTKDYGDLIKGYKDCIEQKWDEQLWLDKWNIEHEARGEAVDEQTGLGTLNEMFTFESWGKQVRLYNFGQTLLSDHQLQELSNALRSVGQLNGGAIFDQLSFMAIFPEGHPFIRSPLANADGKTYIIFNEKVVSDEESLNVSHIQKTQNTISLVPNDLEDLTVHELHHILNNRQPDAYQIPDLDSEKRVSKYAESKDIEDLSETGTALHKGGNVASRVGPLHKKAYSDFVSKTGSGREGPTYVVCRQHDPRKLAN